MALIDRIGLTIPLVQAPMAGVSTPALAAAVSNAGGLGSIALGATDVVQARAAIAAVRSATEHAFGVNVFVHQTPVPDPVRESTWLARLAPHFTEFGARPPGRLRTIYRSFADDPDMLALLLEVAPPADAIAALRERGIVLLATATSLAEGRTVAAAGIDAVVAQGIEAGGHRGMFDPDAPDDALGTLALTRRLVGDLTIPVIAAGGIMDGAGIAAVLKIGAVAAQLGTAFIACPESAAGDAYRAALAGPGADHTVMTRLVSGRPARSLPTRFTALTEALADVVPPDYPRAYDAGKALHAAAAARGEDGYGAQWAGQGAPLARAMPAARLMATLRAELPMRDR